MMGVWAESGGFKKRKASVYKNDGVDFTGNSACLFFLLLDEIWVQV